MAAGARTLGVLAVFLLVQGVALIGCGAAGGPTLLGDALCFTLPTTLAVLYVLA